MTENYPTGLEKNFTVVWWEQRGCGISYDPGMDYSGTTIDQITDDAITLTKYILNRFKKEKLFLMAHSGGTFIGVHVIDKAPDLYHAYVAVAQISDQRRSEVIAYKYMLDEYRRLNDQKMVRLFEGIDMSGSGNLPDEYIKIRDKAMHELGIGTIREMKSLFRDLFIPSLMFSEYTISEKYRCGRGKPNRA